MTRAENKEQAKSSGSKKVKRLETFEFKAPSGEAGLPPPPTMVFNEPSKTDNNIKIEAPKGPER